MKNLQSTLDARRRRPTRWVHLALAATVGVGAGISQGVAAAGEAAASPAEGATAVPTIVTKSMKMKALKDAAAGVRGDAPAAPAMPPTAASGTASPPQAQQPAPGAGATK